MRMNTRDFLNHLEDKLNEMQSELNYLRDNWNNPDILDEYYIERTGELSRQIYAVKFKIEYLKGVII